jgi:integrase
MLGGCDQERPNGRRDFAILLLMSRLGLRAVEIFRMRLDDIDWRSGVLDVHGKGGRFDRLPLPQDVGEAIVEYLRFGRRPSDTRAMFLQASGPAVGMSRNAVVLVARSSCERARIPLVSGHRLRHTAATEMLHHGASMREVGQVLRHDDDTVTAIYAKVDQASLSLVVRPWPQASAR